MQNRARTICIWATPAIQPMPNQVIVYSSTAIIKSILSIPLFAFRYLLIQQMKMNPWQQDDSIDRIVGFLNDSKISFLRCNWACHQSTYLFNYLQLMKHHKPLLDNHFPTEFSTHLIIFLALYINTSQTNFHLLILRRKLPSLNYPTNQLHLLQMMWSRRKMSVVESVNMIAQMSHSNVVQRLDIFTCKYDSYRYIVNMI